MPGIARTPKGKHTLKTRTIVAVLNTFSGSGGGAPVTISRNHRTVLVVTDSLRSFQQYEEAMKDGPSAWLHRARYVYVNSPKDLRGIPEAGAELRFVGHYWNNPMYGHPALHKYPAPLGRYDEGVGLKRYCGKGG